MRHFLFLVLLMFASISSGSIISYDVQTKELVSDNGFIYKSFDSNSTYTYNDLIAATEEGGEFADFHIANKDEAFDFINQFNVQPPIDDNINFTPINWFDGQYGASADSLFDILWFNYTSFIDDVLIGTLGEIDFFDGGVYVYELPYDYTFADSFDNISWLLVSDESYTVNEPIMFQMFLLILAIMFIYERQRRNSTETV